MPFVGSTTATTKQNTPEYGFTPLPVSLNKLTPLQVGHNERLKTLANPNNTNLYLSNLPKNMNEAVRTYSLGHFCFH